MTILRARTTALAAVILAATAATALAHSEVTATSPRAGATASTAITKVTVTFSGPLRSGSIRVTGPDGKVVSRSGGGRDPRNITRLTVALKPGLRPGRHRLAWRAQAADGHRQRGGFSFRLRR